MITHREPADRRARGGVQPLLDHERVQEPGAAPVAGRDPAARAASPSASASAATCTTCSATRCRWSRSKSELAGKLIDRDPQAARRELREVERVAREALGQVRRAVTGIRAAGLARRARVRAAARSSGGDGRFEYRARRPATAAGDRDRARADAARGGDQHPAPRRRAPLRSAELRRDGDEAVLRGRGRRPRRRDRAGNGLCGMRERIEALGGTPARGFHAGAGHAHPCPRAVAALARAWRGGARHLPSAAA